MKISHFITMGLLCASSSVAAFQLNVNGVVTEYLTGAVITNASVRIYKDGVKVAEEVTGSFGHYAVTLDNNAKYILRFTAAGHQTKCFSVDTHGIEWQDQRGTKEVFVEMTLFSKLPDMDLSFFDLPMGMARFEPLTGLLSWDQEYDARIRSEVQSIMADYERRMTATADVATAHGTPSATRR